ncbi:MAG: NADH-quinone oxidoreductase subunit L [Alphaproteobacteria bacterium]|nr:NADH-quinone oxidoreductase subunit L [Alphaproteobacteria bacterium]
MISAIVFLPLLGALISGLLCRCIPVKIAQWGTTALLVASAVMAGILFYQVTQHHLAYHVTLLDWVSSGDFNAKWVLRVDVLTAVMLVVVTSVSSLVHLYSIGYMSHDPHIQRFMSYLSLFTFFMLMLVTSDNLLQLFLGWEGVGLCSYLLIGFWYQRPSAYAAAMKAFIVNRVGDLGFILGVFLIYTTMGSIYFDEIFAKAPGVAAQTITLFGAQIPLMNAICMLLFIGCMGKSAQIGLHTWLPDAMEGPTPVSALIHAATMVTAGVFLVARCSPLFELAPAILAVVTVVGATTAIFAATVAITQNDIKRVVAYSTCSQLGYMFFACGVSAYSAGVFHLMTHAFFKALLFLGCGSVIHAMSDEQDIQKMGGLMKKLPFSFSVMLIGSLSLAGIPPFAGFFSKDVILESAYASGSLSGHFAFWMGICAAFLTAFYSWRLLILTFNGKTRADHHTYDHAHESPLTMSIPLALLAVGAVVAGYIGAHLLGMVDPSLAFWNHSVAGTPGENILAHAHHVPEWVKMAPLAVGLAGIVMAYVFYLWVPSIPTKVAKKLRPLYLISFNKWYFDELYGLVFVRGVKKLGTFCWRIIDTIVIDGFGPNGSARVSHYWAVVLSRVQSGYVYHYAFVMLLGTVGIIFWYLYRITG